MLKRGKFFIGRLFLISRPDHGRFHDGTSGLDSPADGARNHR